MPYGVRIEHKEFDIDATRYYLDSISCSGRVRLSFREEEGAGLRTGIEFMDFDKGDKPYLFPLSSMTEEQKDDYDKACEEDVKFLIETSNTVPITNVSVAPSHKVDWLNKNHFDYRGLIPKGLAIDATGLRIYN